MTPYQAPPSIIVISLFQVTPGCVGCLPHVIPRLFNFRPGPGTDLGEKEGPTLFPAQDSGAHPSFLTGWQQQASPGGGGSPDGSGAAGELSHQAVCIKRSPRLG